ncbi:MAG: FtsW/RodA/SpoVE family cell cycle protein, partial [Eggerthellaceae bacterium]|nr:FtsW/RodA/SpoVE family cell cycle protein [Eggerthellaceae bacterium]
MARAHTAETSPRTSIFSGSADTAGPRLALVVAVFFLCVMGLVMVFSASSVEALSEGTVAFSYFARQAVAMSLGVVLCALLAVKVPYEVWLGRWLDFFWVGAIVLLLLTALIGTVGLGAQRWLTLGGITGQPSELAKVAFVLMGARIMYNARVKEMDFSRFTLQMLLLVGLPLVILYFTQSDLGTTLICLVGILAVVFLSGANLFVVAGLVAGLLVFALAAVMLRGYRSDRMSFLDPEADYYGSGYQLVRSFYAFGEGGLFGVGLGNSSEKYLYLPEAETDFIFAIVGEELGLVGAVAVVVAFLVVLWAGLRIARN